MCECEEVSPDEGEASLSRDLAPSPHTTKYSTNGGGGICINSPRLEGTEVEQNLCEKITKLFLQPPRCLVCEQHFPGFSADSDSDMCEMT